MSSRLPQKLTIRAHGPGRFAGLAVNLCFRMSRKNDFNFFVFLDESGSAKLRQSEYLRHFDQQRDFFLMDYVDPRGAFTGDIAATVLNVDDLKSAIRALDRFRGNFAYPEGHGERLEKALAVLESGLILPDDIALTI